MNKPITILFFFLSFGLTAQPNYNNPTKWTAKYNPQTKKPDYAVNLSYINGLISDLEVLESGYGIVSFTYNGQATATVIVDTSSLFGLVRCMISDSTLWVKSSDTTITSKNDKIVEFPLERRIRWGIGDNCPSGIYGDSVHYLEYDGAQWWTFKRPTLCVSLCGVKTSYFYYNTSIFQGSWSKGMRVLHNKTNYIDIGVRNYNNTYVPEMVFYGMGKAFILSKDMFDNDVLQISTSSPLLRIWDDSLRVNSLFSTSSLRIRTSPDYASASDTSVLVRDNSNGMVKQMPMHYVNTTPKHTFYATPGQTNFDCSSYFKLNDNYKVYVNGALNESGHNRSVNTIIFNTGRTESDEVTITL